MRDSGSEQERFAAIFREFSPRVYAFVRRRADASTAQEVVADTFLVAWRRFDAVPEEPLPAGPAQQRHVRVRAYLR